MKTLIIIIVLLATFASEAATFNIGADPYVESNNATAYKFYSVVGTNSTLIATSPFVVGTVTLPDGAYTLTETSVNAKGESPPSDPLFLIIKGTNIVAVTSVPSKLLNLQLR